MKPWKLWPILPMLLVVFSLTSGLALAPKSLNVPLKWTTNPRGNVPEPTLETTGGIYAVRLEPVVDKRDNTGGGKQIGENTEKSPVVPIFTDTNVATFLDEVVRAQLKRTGLELVADGAERVVRPELMEFWTIETSTYRSTVRLKVSVTDVQGKEIWSGIVGGGENWGRSLKPQNYTESISNSILDLVANLVKSQGFVGAIRKTPTSVE